MLRCEKIHSQIAAEIAGKRTGKHTNEMNEMTALEIIEPKAAARKTMADAPMETVTSTEKAVSGNPSAGGPDCEAAATCAESTFALTAAVSAPTTGTAPPHAPQPLRPLIHIVLFAPQIAPNTGNVGRLCAVTCSRLHLIHPLGFEINDRNLRRAGMDYWHSLDVHEHTDWDAFRASPFAPQRLWLFTTKSTQSFWAASFADGDGLVFGNEGSGAPDWLHAEIGTAHGLTIPQRNAALRSLNLSTAVGIATYEAYRSVTCATHARTTGCRT